MAVSNARKTLIAHLNEDLSREYQAIIAYVVYSQTLKGAEYMSIAKELETHAGEELQHALTIAKHIDYLGGMPTTVAAAGRARPTRRATMLRADLDNENDDDSRVPRARRAVRGARRVRHRRRHPRDPAAGAGAPDRSGDGARRGRARCLEPASLIRQPRGRRRRRDPSCSASNVSKNAPNCSPAPTSSIPTRRRRAPNVVRRFHDDVRLLTRRLRDPDRRRATRACPSRPPASGCSTTSTSSPERRVRSRHHLPRASTRQLPASSPAGIAGTGAHHGAGDRSRPAHRQPARRRSAPPLSQQLPDGDAAHDRRAVGLAERAEARAHREPAHGWPRNCSRREPPRVGR